MIQHGNSLFTQSPAVTPRFTVEGLALQQWWQLFVRAQNLPGSQLQPYPMVCSTGKTSVLILANAQN